MPRGAWRGALAALALARAAAAQPPGDPTPGSQAPLVVIVNPMTGALVGPRILVQARVHDPSGLEAIASVSLSIAGARTATVSLARSAAPPAATGAEIWAAVVDLAPGAATLVATATDAAGRSTSSAPVAVTVNAGGGDGNILRRDDASTLCTACHALPDHGSETAGRAYGAWTTTCRDCHAPHGTRNAWLVRETIAPPWVAGDAPPAARAVRFATRTGYVADAGEAAPVRSSFANADGSGPCQVCHTRTARWRAAGAADPIHLGDCAFCHRHATGFRSRCEDCHPAPPQTGAHLAHHGASAPTPPFPSDPRPLGCGNCHPHDPARHGDGTAQIALDPDLVLPGGTRTTGAQATVAGASTTCLVACHFPLGAPAPSAPVAWSVVGPLPCTSCHARIDPGGMVPTPRAGPSLHDPVFSEARPPSGEPTTCFSCHAAAAHDATHLTGAPGLVADRDVNAACIGCHSPPSGPGAAPEGQVLHSGAGVASSRTPPVLPGWSEATIDATSGDFHGGRRGTCFDPNRGPVPCAPGVVPTGYGGTLKAPWARGQAAMPCTACHAGHASANAFLLAPVVNGTAIPAGAIDRAGVGAEKLCEACHEGGRHDRCKECHTDAYVCDQGQCWMDPAANHVDPAPPGSACFWCHGHEGILQWTEPYSGQNMQTGNCAHCHSFSMPAVDYRPPAISWNGSVTVSSITSTTAKVAWQTDEASTSWVEYGTAPGWVAGSPSLVASHVVALAGLAPGTTYAWRIRSADAHRNVLQLGTWSFTTTPAGGVPFPDLVPVGWAGVPTPQTTETVALQWHTVASPAGNPVEYRVQLASDETFTTLANGSPPDSGWIPGAPGSAADLRTFTVTLTNLPQDDCSSATPPSTPYYWRVKARDTVTFVESDWSPVDVFQALAYDPYGC